MASSSGKSTQVDSCLALPATDVNKFSPVSDSEVPSSPPRNPFRFTEDEATLAGNGLEAYVQGPPASPAQPKVVIPLGYPAPVYHMIVIHGWLGDPRPVYPWLGDPRPVYPCPVNHMSC